MMAAVEDLTPSDDIQYLVDTYYPLEISPINYG